MATGATNAKHHVIRTEVVEDEAIRANDLTTGTTVIGDAAEVGTVVEWTIDRENYAKEFALAADAEATSDATARKETSDARRQAVTGTTGTETTTDATREAVRLHSMTAESTSVAKTTQIHQGKTTQDRRARARTSATSVAAQHQTEILG